MRTILSKRFRTNQLWVGTALVAALAIGALLGSSFARQSVAAQAAALSFSGQKAVVVQPVNAANTADYERVMKAYGETLAASSNAERARMGAGLQLYRAAEGGQGGSVLYVTVLDPVVRGGDYQQITVLAEEFGGGPPGNGDEVRELYSAYTDALAPGAFALNMTLVAEF